MKPPSPADINRTLREIERTELPEEHPRKLAQDAIARYRRGSAIDRSYDFTKVPAETKQIFYDAAVRFIRRRLWSKVLR